MNENLLAIIEYNRQILGRAKQLNIRAGQEEFHIPDRQEWKEWFFERLGGARKIDEIQDYEILKIPELDTDKVQEILENNPETFLFNGSPLTIEYGQNYGWGLYCRTIVTEDFVRHCHAEAIVLPSGRTVELKCEGFSSNSISELLDRLESQRISKCWEKVRQQHEIRGVTDLEEVLALLGKVGNEVKVATTLSGEDIVAYLTLKKYFYPISWGMALSSSLEEVQTISQIWLEPLFDQVNNNYLVIPNEQPWQEEKASKYGWASEWEITELGKEFQSLLAQLKIKSLADITPKNFMERVATFQEGVEKIKKRLLPQKEEEVVEERVEPEVEEITEEVEVCENSCLTGFTHTKGRNFLCECGCQTRLTKSKMQAYRDGEAVRIECSVCHRVGMVKGIPQKKIELPKNVSGRGTSLSALQQKWGGNH